MIVPFPSRPDPHPSVERFRLKVTLRKGDRIWFYEVRPLALQEAQTWVRYNGQPHRALMVRDVGHCERIHAQYLREIASLEQDGWARDGP